MGAERLPFSTFLHVNQLPMRVLYATVKRYVILRTLCKILISLQARLGYVSQTRDLLNSENSVWREITEGEDWVDMGYGRKIASRAYVAQVFCY